MSDRASRREAPRGARTRFDRRGQNALFIGGAAVLLAIAALVVLFIVTQEGASQRAFDVTPRNFDLWAVYPNGRLRFATLFTLDDTIATGAATETVTAAGPLVASADQIVSREAVGAALIGQELQPGPGQDSALLFELFTLERERSGQPYGIDVFTAGSPYAYAEADGTQVLALGTEVQTAYAQVIVAVAVPVSARPAPDEAFPPYRRARIDGWQVFYFDATTVQAGDSIRVRFQPIAAAPPDLDVLEVNARR